MPLNIARLLGQRYAFVVIGVIFLALMTTAGLRSTPGVLMLPLVKAFGWSRAEISFAAAVGIFLFGLVGPFAAAAMQSFGIRRTMLAAMAVMALSTLASAFMTQTWQLILTWGVFSGLASGCVATVLGAAVVNRWFAARRGLMMGLLSASAATGTLVFLPGLAALAETFGWRAVVFTVAGVIAALMLPVLLLLPETPEAAGVTPYGADPLAPPAPRPPYANPIRAALGALVFASRRKEFWLLFATFFICGFTTNGLVGTHMISLCADHGMAEVKAAGLLAMMGIFDLFGTTASGWLTDRYDPRKLLFVYYGLRGLSLMYLPFSDFSFYGLSIFAVFYGLDWIATVPPTLKLANEAFGDQKAPVIFGWIFAGHQLGAATAAFMAGAMRTLEGRYMEAFLIAGATGLAAAVMALMIAPAKRQAARALAA